MFRKVALLLVLLCVAGGAAAQDAPARLRLNQLSYAGSGATADLLIDDVPAFTGITWPFMTDYVELAAGTHTLTATLVDDGGSASLPLTLEAGHSYSVVVHGDHAEGVTWHVIDESDLPLAETGGAAIILNLTSEPITDLRIDDAPAIDPVLPGEHTFLSLPSAPYTMAGRLGDLAYRDDFNPLSNAFLLGVVRRTPNGELQIIFQRSSPLTVDEYLKAILPGTLFSGFAGGLSAEAVEAILPEEGAYTLFLPTNDALEAAGARLGGVVDAAQLAGHTTAQHLPPTALPNYDMLPMLDGRAARLAFTGTPSGYWEIDGAAILWDLRLANGVIYAIDGVLGAQGG